MDLKELSEDQVRRLKPGASVLVRAIFKGTDRTNHLARIAVSGQLVSIRLRDVGFSELESVDAGSPTSEPPITSAVSNTAPPQNITPSKDLTHEGGDSELSLTDPGKDLERLSLPGKCEEIEEESKTSSHGGTACCREIKDGSESTKG